MRPKFQPQGIWASRLGFEPEGWDMGFEAEGPGGGYEEREGGEGGEGAGGENSPVWKHRSSTPLVPLSKKGKRRGRVVRCSTTVGDDPIIWGPHYSSGAVRNPQILLLKFMRWLDSRFKVFHSIGSHDLTESIKKIELAFNVFTPFPFNSFHINCPFWMFRVFVTLNGKHVLVNKWWKDNWQFPTGLNDNYLFSICLYLTPPMIYDT